jgi:patatin-like phospholipase/acyl hydrolase
MSKWLSNDGRESFSPPDNTNKKRTIFVLYVPGGAMMGIVPVAVLARLKQLTECSAVENFQVFCGVSTGSIPAGGLNVRSADNPCRSKLTEEESLQLFCEEGPVFFPNIPQRYSKMITANLIYLIQDTFDPLRKDALQIRDIVALCHDMHNKANGLFERDIADIQSLATKKWLTRNDKARLLIKCDSLREKNDGFSNETRKISELVHVRRNAGTLSKIFTIGALGGLSFVRNHWAKDYLFDPSIPQGVYDRIFGDARMSDCIRSTFISAYDKEGHEAVNFFCRKDDFFSLSPDNPSVTNEGNHRIADAVMASTANPFAFPPHKTEDGRICSDKATIHSPLFCVSEILNNKPKDTDVKLIILGTGKHMSADQKEHDAIEYNVNFGVLGNFVQGQELDELQAYTMSQMRESLKQILGEDNIIEINPLLSPHTYQESLQLPSSDMLDASPGNIDRILKTAQKLMIEDDSKIRMLAAMMVENNYNIGMMSEEKYRRVSANLGICLLPPPPDKPPAPPHGGLPGLVDMFKNAIDRFRPQKRPQTGRLPDINGQDRQDLRGQDRHEPRA